jgi:hypothetical protein
MKMANFEILNQSDYGDGVQLIELRVSFADQVFEQSIVSKLVGDELMAQLQTYADDYEAGWLEPEVEQVVVDETPVD